MRPRSLITPSPEPSLEVPNRFAVSTQNYL
jgi:hypothetical protein